MSLIACIVKHSIPMLMGDLLFSSKIVDEGVRLPTNNFDIDSSYLPPNLVYKPHSLNQKLYIIRDNVCLALAGNAFEMREFLIEFKQRCSYTSNVTEIYIRQFLDEYDFPSKFPDSAFFIIMTEKRMPGSIYVGLFNYPNNGAWKVTNTAIYGNVQAFGSGADAFLSVTRQEAKFISSFPEGDIWNVIQANLVLVAKLFAVERVTLYTLANLWGGGFETIIYTGKAFIKFDKIAYLVSHGEFDTQGEIRQLIPRLILYCYYEMDFLIITAIEIIKAKQERNGEVIKITSENDEYAVNIFIIPPIDYLAPPEKIETMNFSFETNHIAMGYAIRTQNNGVYNPGFYSNEKSVKVIYTEGEKVELFLSSKLEDNMRHEAKTIFPSL